MEERTITPMRKITESSLKLRRMDFGKRREKNMLAAKEKSTPFCRLESLETESEKRREDSSRSVYNPVATAPGSVTNGCFRWARFRLADERDRIEGETAAGRSSQAAPAHRPRRRKRHRWEFSVM